MIRLTKKILLTFIIIHFLTGCNNKKNESGDISMPDKSIEIINLTDEQIEHAGIETVTLSVMPLSEEVNTKGKISVSPKNITQNSAIIEGLVDEIYIELNQFVSKGQKLAKINSLLFIDVQKQYLQLKQKALMLKKNIDRKKDLNNKNIVADREMEMAENEYEETNIALNAILAQLELLNITENDITENSIKNNYFIYSKGKGIVNKINVSLGSSISSGESLFEITDISKSWLELNILSKDYNLIKPGMKVTFSPEGTNNKYYSATITSIAGKIEEKTRFLKAYAKINNFNKEKLVPGLFVNAMIKTSTDSVLAVPKSALFTDTDLNYFVFISLPESRNSFKRIEVETGITSNGYTQVSLLSELPDNALLVNQGGYYLKSELLK